MDDDHFVAQPKRKVVLMFKPFVRDEHVGFICVQFVDTDECTRWPVSRDWKHVGEETLAKATAHVLEYHCATAPGSVSDTVLSLLADLVVEAAIESYFDVLPCRSYALMEAFGSPYLMIEATRAEGSVLSIRAFAVSSAAQADELIDALEEERGFASARYSSDGAGNATTIIPVAAVGMLPTNEELMQGLPASLTDGLTDALNDPEFRAQLLAAMQSHERGGSFRVH